MTSNGDEVSKGIAYHLAKCGCRLALMGDEDVLWSMVAEITSSLKGTDQFKVIGLNIEEESEAAFDAAVGKAWKSLGALDAFINCYIFEGEIQEPLLVAEDEYKKIIKINVMAPWFLLKAIAKRMKESKSGGSVIFLTTIMGAERGLHVGAAAFGSSMAAVQQLTRASALELGKHKIRVNSIARGLHLGDKYPVSEGIEKAKKMTTVVMPLQRWLDLKNDLASTMLYLISDDSRYLTGTTIFVDGAQSIVRPRLRSYI